MHVWYMWAQGHATRWPRSRIRLRVSDRQQLLQNKKTWADQIDPSAGGQGLTLKIMLIFSHFSMKSKVWKWHKRKSSPKTESSGIVSPPVFRSVWVLWGSRGTSQVPVFFSCCKMFYGLQNITGSFHQRGGESIMTGFLFWWELIL